ncbi:MFS general substrate transporter [Metschnikowia bicuspidata var. bicuspidata NRRL YB-4993]|uniref:MFS general substrate transporter n=1 Tax=Metschnikowia bicuspidata var. bicuspidata NRRL YB-4993 TaxID=869754 RepID=A0A1A0HJ56_9ASCO|nr:MFS general substrate transporter [Metschnikowia bicuspidata var. bicuspidata NRRL YB-4993]OBA23873.1 MFS general substrate transporter [Metschnikowia bicuspidata var. bicuspidata NRRL YB-4993]
MSSLSLPDTKITSKIQFADHLEDPRAAVGKAKLASRPIAITRQSNDYFTNLTRHSTVNIEAESIGGDPLILLPRVSQQPPKTKFMTSSFPPRNKWRIWGSCLWSIAGGFSDAAPGALLPTIEAHYSISYSVVSLIWMSNAIGFITVALLSHKIQPWLGKEKSIPFGCICLVIMYAIVASGGPFPLVVVGFFFGGMGIAVVLSQLNIFLSKMEKNSKYLSFFHGSYGIGATISPFLATTMIERNVRWNYVYLIILGLMIINLVNLTMAFKGADEDLKYWDHDDETDRLLDSEASEIVSGSQTPAKSEAGIGLQDLGTHVTSIIDSSPSKSQNDSSDLKLALKNTITWNISFFTLFYQGCEVALGGWIVTYLIDYRLTTTSFGYVLSGFWGGLTLGRLFMTRPLHKFLGVKRSVNLLVLTTILMLILTWVVSSDILLSVFVSIAGTLIGPIYPLMITGVSTMLPRKIQVISLTIMTAFGSSGGAIVPFLVGLISQSSGTFVVLPICIAGYSLVLMFWLMLPNTDRKGERPTSVFERLLHLIW